MTLGTISVWTLAPISLAQIMIYQRVNKPDSDFSLGELLWVVEQCLQSWRTDVAAEWWVGVNDKQEGVLSAERFCQKSVKGRGGWGRGGGGG